MAAVFFNAAGNQSTPIPLFAVANGFGLLSLAMRKFMIITPTAFTGSYLVVAGLFHLRPGLQNLPPLWFNHAQPHSAGNWGYVALVFWGILALAGVSFQNRVNRTKTPVAPDRASLD